MTRYVDTPNSDGESYTRHIYSDDGREVGVSGGYLPESQSSNSGSSIARGLVFGALIASHRLREGLGIVALVLIFAGFLASLFGSREVAQAGIFTAIIGAVLGFVRVMASVGSKLARVVAEDVKEEYAGKEENIPHAPDDLTDGERELIDLMRQNGIDPDTVASSIRGTVEKHQRR